MATPPFAETEDLTAWIGEDASGDRGEALLSAASALVQAYVGGSTVTDAWTDVPAIVAQVVVQAAARVWFNPQGLTGDAIDDYSRRWGSSEETGVILTTAERDMLSQYRTTGPKGLWTLGTTRGDDYADQYLDVSNAATPTVLEEPMPFLPAGE